MAGNDQYMDKTCAWLKTLLAWVDRQSTSPIHFAGIGRTFGTRPAPFLELIYLSRGDIPQLAMGPLTTSVRQGQAALLGVHFGNVAPPEAVFEGQCVFLDVPSHRPFDVLAKAPLAIVGDVRDQARVSRAFDHVIQRCRASAWTLPAYKPGRPLRNSSISVAGQALLKAALLELLATLLEEMAPAVDSGPMAGLPAGVDEAVAMMHRMYHQPDLDRDELAAAAALHPDHFTRAFKRYLDVTPMQYLTQLRINQAGFLLQHTDQRVSDIAEQVGFVDAFHFSRVFRQQMKQSPRAYREKSRQESR